MKRLLSFALSVLLAASSIVPAASAIVIVTTETYDGPADSNFYAAEVIQQYANGVTISESKDAIDDDTDGDVRIGKDDGEAFYIGFPSKFDGISLELHQEGGDALWMKEYWDGDEWVDFFYGPYDLENNDEGVYSYEWDEDLFSDKWEARTIDVDSTGDTTDSLYFIRIYFNSSDYSKSATANRVGVLKYNLQVNLEDELGNTLSDQKTGLTLDTADETIYASKDEGSGVYLYALHPEVGGTSTSYSWEYDYIFEVDGFVAKEGEVEVSRTTVADIEAELEFAYKITGADELGTAVDIDSADNVHVDCVIEDGDAYCPFSIDTASSTLSMYAEGYVTDVNFLLGARTAHTDPQYDLEAEFDHAYLIKLLDVSDGTGITEATVHMGENLNYECNLAKLVNFYCALPVGEGSDIEVVAEGYETLSTSVSDEGKTARTDSTDARVELTLELTPGESDGGTSEGSDGGTSTETNGPDFEVDNIYIDDEELKFRLTNEGDEDVEEEVDIKIYVNGDLEKTIETSTANWLEAGESSVYNLGDDFLGSRDEYDVEVCVDTDDVIDETDEDNNCLAKTVELDEDDDALPDLTVEDLEVERDGTITFLVRNEGYDDVDEDEAVHIYVYVDGEREWSEKYELGDGDDWLEAGAREVIEVEELLEDDEEYTVRVCVDARDLVEEEDEDDNCMTRDLEPGVGGKNSRYCRMFIDLNAHWAADAVCELVDRDIVEGRDNGRYYEPNDDITRAELTKILLLNAGRNIRANDNYVYNDLPSYHWAHEYMTYASGIGMIRGYSDGNVRPDQPVTRGEAVVMIMRLYGEELWGYDSGDINFSDVETWDWYAYAVILAESYDIIGGYYDDTFRPANNLSRAEAAVMAVRTADALN